MNRVIFQYLHKLSRSPFFYVMSFAFVAFVAMNWFLGQRFFTEVGTTDLHHFFSSFPLAYILYVPFLASLSNLKGQWSFPYGTLTIAFSKLLSVVMACTLCMLLTLTVPLCISFFGDVECSQLFCGYFGILLYAFCTSSFVILIYSIIGNSAASFVVSALFLAACNSIHNIPLFIDCGTVVSFIVKSISFAWNFDSFAKGIISLHQVLYFLIATVLFLFLLVLTVERRRGNANVEFHKTAWHVAVSILLLTIANGFITLKIDLTKSKKYTVTEYSRNLISKISEPVSITYYLSPELKNLYPQVKDVADFLESYASNSSLVSMIIKNPDSKQMQEKLSACGINGQSIRTNSVSSSTVSKVYSSVVIDYLGMTETIPFVLAATTLEFDLAQKINSLVEERKNLIQVVFANGLSPEKDYSYIFPYLKSLGYIPFVTELPSKSLDENKDFTFFPKVPLIVLGCEEFTRKDCSDLEKFILDGGKAFIATQPYSVNISDDWSIFQNENHLLFERMLFTFGLYFKPTLTCDISNFRITMVSNVQTDGTQTEQKSEYINYSLWPVLRPQQFSPDGMTTFWPCSIDIDNEVAAIENLTASPLLTTSSGSWQMKKIDGSFNTNPFSCPKAPSETEERGPFNIAACVCDREKNDDIKLILLADQYALSTPMISYSSGQTIDWRSLEFLGNGILMLCGQKDLLQLKNKSVFNHSLYKVSSNELPAAVQKTFFICLAIPAIIIVGVGIFSKGKRRKFYR